MRTLSLTALMMAGIAACATAPSTPQDRQNLEAEAQATLETMIAQDPGLRGVLDGAAGYVVIPAIAKGGAVVGAAYGRGILFEQGRPTGWIELNQGSIGAQLGGQEFAELIVLEKPVDVQRLKQGQFSIGANISAVAVTEGVAASTRFQDGLAVFVLPKGGLMAELTVSGQQLNFQPRG